MAARHANYERNTRVVQPQDAGVGIHERFWPFLPQHFVNWGTGPFDIASGQALAKAGSTQPVAFTGPMGRATTYGDASGVNYYPFEIKPPQTRQNCTIVWAGQATADGIILRDFSNAGGSIALWKNGGQYDLRWAGTDFAAAGTWANNVDTCIVVSATTVGATTSVELWANGVLQISGTAAGTDAFLVSWTLHRNGNNAQGVSARDYHFSTYAKGFPSDLARDVSKNPSMLFEDQRIWVPASAGAGSGTTITGALGTAVASGFKGNVNAARILAGSLGTATASGFKGNVNANRTIAGTLGTAVASGFKGNVNANRTIVGTLGVAVASGFQGTVVNGAGTTITGNLGTAVASGFKGNVNANRTIAGNLGVAVASGFTGGVQNGTPAPEPPHRRHAGGYYKHKKGYLIKGERYYLDDRELAIKVADMLTEISRSDVKEITAGKPRVVSKRTWTELKATMGRLEALETNDEEEEEALLMFI